MTKHEIAYLLLRVTLGANIFLHGFSRWCILSRSYNRGAKGTVAADPWAVDIGRVDCRQPADARATDWGLLAQNWMSPERNSSTCCFILLTYFERNRWQEIAVEWALIRRDD